MRYLLCRLPKKRYTIGPVQLGSVVVDRLSSWSLDLGLKPEQIMLDSATAPTNLSLPEVLPKFDFEGHAAELYAAANIDSGGKAATHANTFAWLRQRKAGGTGFEADNAAKHMKFTA